MKDIQYTEVLEVELTANKLKYQLQYQPTIEHGRIVGIAAYPASGKSINGITLASPDNAYLRLKDKQNDTRIEIGLAALRFNPGTPLLVFLPLDMDQVDWTKSEIEFGAGSTVANDTALQLQVVYERDRD